MFQQGRQIFRINLVQLRPGFIPHLIKGREASIPAQMNILRPGQLPFRGLHIKLVLGCFKSRILQRRSLCLKQTKHMLALKRQLASDKIQAGFSFIRSQRFIASNLDFILPERKIIMSPHRLCMPGYILVQPVFASFQCRTIFKASNLCHPFKNILPDL